MMTEAEYIKVSNKAALLHAKDIMRDVMEGKQYGVDEVAYAACMVSIGDMLEAIFKELDDTITERSK